MTDSLVFVTGRLRSAWTVAVMRSALTAGQKNVLVVLREFADFRTGGNARPGLDTLTAASGASRSVVKDALSAAVSAGFIVRVKRGGGRGGAASVYQLSMPESVVSESLALLGRGPIDDGSELDSRPDSDGNGAGHAAPFDDNGAGHAASFPNNGAGDAASFESNVAGAAASLERMGPDSGSNGAGYAAPTYRDHKNIGVTYVGNSLADPSPASPSPESDSEGASDASGIDAADLGVDLDGPPPAARCGRHIGVDWAPPCGKCADARRRFEAWDAARLERNRRAAEAKRLAVEACGKCDPWGRIDVDGVLRACDHRPDLRVVGW